MFDQIPFRDLTTPAGILVAGVLIRQVIEIAKHSLLPWLDAGNEKKGAVLLAAALYAAWAAAYARDLSVDGWTALFAALSVAGTAVGVNEGIDGARDQLAKNVVTALRRRPSLIDSAGGEGPPVVASAPGRVAPAEGGPDLDLLVAGGDPVEESLDPAFAEVR
jgi:hypothetical protein